MYGRSKNRHILTIIAHVRAIKSGERKTIKTNIQMKIKPFCLLDSFTGRRVNKPTRNILSQVHHRVPFYFRNLILYMLLHGQGNTTGMCPLLKYTGFKYKMTITMVHGLFVEQPILIDF